MSFTVYLKLEIYSYFIDMYRILLFDCAIFQSKDKKLQTTTNFPWMTRDMSDNIGRMSFSCLIRLFMYICSRYLFFRHQIVSKIWYHNGRLPILSKLSSAMVRFSDFFVYSFRFLLFVNCAFPTFPLCFYSPFSLVLLRTLNQLISNLHVLLFIEFSYSQFI